MTERFANARCMKGLQISMSLGRLLTCLSIGALVVGCAARRDTEVVDGAVVVFESSRAEVTSHNARTGKPIAAWSHDRDGSRQFVVDASVIGRPLVISHGRGGVAVHDAHTGEVSQRILMRLHPSERPRLSRTSMFLPAWAEPIAAPFGAVREAEQAGAWIGFDLKTGRRTIDVRADRLAPLVANDDVLATLENGALVGYSAEDGRERWRSQVAVVRPLVITGNHLLVELPDDRLGVFVASSGALDRTLEPGAEAFDCGLGGEPNLRATRGLAATLTSAGLSVLELPSGRRAFQDADAQAFSFAGDRLIVVTPSEVRALDLSTGKLRWKASITGVTSLSSDGDIAAVGSSSGLAVFETQTGKKLYETTQ